MYNLVSQKKRKRKKTMYNLPLKHVFSHGLLYLLFFHI